MERKNLKFASVLMCAAFVPQAMGVSAIAKKDDIASKYKKYMSGNGVISAAKSDEFGEDLIDDEEDYDDFSDSSQGRTKRGASFLKKKGLISKAVSSISSLFTARRYKNARSFLKKIAIFGALGYGTINFVPQVIEKVTEKSSVDSEFYSDGINPEIWKLLQNPSVDFSFVIGDDVGKDDKSKEKAKKSVKEVATFLERFKKAYDETGGSIKIDSFKSGVDFGKNYDEAVRYFANIGHLNTGEIAKVLNPNDTEKMKKQLDMVVNYETKRIGDTAIKDNEGQYHGVGVEGSEDSTRGVKLMLEGGKKAATQVGGTTFTSIGSSLTLALPGWWKVWGVACTVVGALFNFFNQENQKKENQQQSFSGS